MREDRLAKVVCWGLVGGKGYTREQEKTEGLGCRNSDLQGEKEIGIKFEAWLEAAEKYGRRLMTG